MLSASAIAGVAFAGSLAWLPTATADSRRDTETVPRVIAYTGTLERDGSGLTVTAGLRFSLSTADSAVVWTEERSALATKSCASAADCSVQVHNGAFSVMLGQYVALSDDILDAEDLYLSIAVYDGATWVNLAGRQRITPTPYAMWSLGSTDLSVGGDLAVSQTATVSGTLDVTGASTLRGGTTLNGGATINGGATVNGNATFNNPVTLQSSATVNGAATLNGATAVNNTLSVSGAATLSSTLAVTGQTQANGGARFRGGFSMETPDLVFENIAGRGNGRALVAQSGDQLVVNYAGDFTGGVRVESNLEATGTVTGRSTYNFNGTESLGNTDLPRYHMRATHAGIGSATLAIPHAIMLSHCADDDGCEVRIGMQYWNTLNDAAYASREFMFHYANSNGAFRTSTDGIGIDGDSAVHHAYNAFDTCYLTDTPYSGGVQGTDTTRQMYLLMWNGYGGASRNCNLTIID